MKKKKISITKLDEIIAESIRVNKTNREYLEKMETDERSSNKNEIV